MQITHIRTKIFVAAYCYETKYEEENASTVLLFVSSATRMAVSPEPSAAGTALPPVTPAARTVVSLVSSTARMALPPTFSTARTALAHRRAQQKQHNGWHGAGVRITQRTAQKSSFYPQCREILGKAEAVAIMGASVNLETILTLLTEHLLLVGECACVRGRCACHIVILSQCISHHV